MYERIALNCSVTQAHHVLAEIVALPIPLATADVPCPDHVKDKLQRAHVKAMSIWRDVEQTGVCGAETRLAVYQASDATLHVLSGGTCKMWWTGDTVT